ncbi:MAG: fibronectin type III domain-containing protein, partial [Bacteroidia bacterium]
SVALVSSYRLEYRAQNLSPQWYPVTTADNAARLFDLTAQRTYEARVQGIMPNGQPGAWSDIVTFTTPAEAIIACGQTAPAPGMQNFKPLISASVGQTWQIGQFDMLVTQLQSIANPQGYYSGLGKIKMFGVVGVACSFQNIRMNEELQMVAGEVHAISDGIDNWLSQANASGMIAPEITVSTVIDNPGDILVDTAAGTLTINGQTFTYTPEEGTAIEDANGALWVVTANGSVVFAGQTGAVPLSLIHNHINTTTGSAVFGNAATSLYGFDAHLVPAWRLYYKDVTDRKDNSIKAVSWKSVQGGKYDEVTVQLTLSNTVNPDSIFFFSHTGTRYQSHGTGTTRKFYVVGGNNADRQEIYAGYYHAPDSLVNIGKVNVISFEQKEEVLHLVPLTSGNASAPAVLAAQAAQLEAQLNAAYAGAVVKWVVKTDAALTAQNWDADNDGKVKVGGTGLSRYSDEMKAINNQLRSSEGYTRQEHYL